MTRSLAAIALTTTALIVLLCAIQSEAKVFTVGGSGLSPWGFGVKRWKPKGVIHAGDTLLFKWTGVPHDVWIMNSIDAYNNCNFGAATKKTGITSAGKFKYKVPASAKGTSILFSCSVPGHCSADNMKVAVDDSSRAAALLRALAGGNGQLEGGVESGANGVPSAEQQDSIQRTMVFANDVESVDAIGRLFQRHLSSSAAATSAVVADDMAVGGAADVAAERGADVAWCVVYHKDVPLDERERTLRRFQEGGGMLVCTDAASRGIDVEHVSHVVQQADEDTPQASSDEPPLPPKAMEPRSGIDFLRCSSAPVTLDPPRSTVDDSAVKDTPTATPEESPREAAFSIPLAVASCSKDPQPTAPSPTPITVGVSVGPPSATSTPKRARSGKWAQHTLLVGGRRLSASNTPADPPPAASAPPEEYVFPIRADTGSPALTKAQLREQMFLEASI
ncbi:unnamed protein product, partial [Closterium sp. NIES-54]